MTTEHEFRIGAWSNLAGGRTAEILSRCGADWVALDAQHGMYDQGAVESTL